MRVNRVYTEPTKQIALDMPVSLREELLEAKGRYRLSQRQIALRGIDILLKLLPYEAEIEAGALQSGNTEAEFIRAKLLEVMDLQNRAVKAE